MIFTVALCCGLSVSAFAVQANLSDISGQYWSDTGKTFTSIDFSAGSFPLSYTTNFVSDSSLKIANGFYVTGGIPSFVSSGDRFYFKYILPYSDYGNFESASYIFYGSSISYSSRINVDYLNKTATLTNSVLSYPFKSSDFNYSFITDSSGNAIGFSFDVAYLRSCGSIRIYNYYNSTVSAVFTTTYSSYDDLIISTEPISDTPTYTPTITASASNITSTTIDFSIEVTGMNPAKTYNIRMDGTTAGGEEISEIIGTITGQENYSISSEMGPFEPNTTYPATYVLLEDGVEVSSYFLTFTTLPPEYDPQLSISPFSVTSNTMTCQIDMTDFDPSGSYRLYYDLALYEDVGDTSSSVSKGYSNQIGIVSGISDFTGYHRFTDLTPGTEYYVAWTVEDLATGTAVPVVDSVTFTTLDDGSGGGGSGSSDDSSGILLMILNKVSAILDTLNGGQSEGILASINEKLDALIDTLANPEEQQLEDNFKDSLIEVNNNFFGDDAPGQAVRVSDVGNLANTQGTVKTIFQSDYTVSDFFALFSDSSFFGWFSAETAMDLNPLAYGSPSAADLDDPYNMQEYYDNLEKVRGKK